MDAKPFDKTQMQWVESETERRIQQFTEPRQLFLELLNLMVEKKVELPSYHYFSELITRCYLNYEGNLTTVVKAHLTADDKKQLDCLLHSEKARSRGRLADFRSIQSTDTHGYTETIFASMHFHNVAFAPRIKNIGKQTIYGFYNKNHYQKKGYQILPSRPINVKLIRSQWDNILRFMATIRLKECSASQLYKGVPRPKSQYFRQHH